MIDATKFARPVKERQESGAAAGEPARADNAPAVANQVASYPAKNLKLEGGRYFPADTKK